ncbi:hypothetical protein [Psychrobacter urativorans]|uniref:hypothetical protein n=1 Tax=Psychrobacter urativorans TaxID=45610 RepID=UPI001D0FC4BD|nr:hypothetical protein [Psychrobacter urativorans]
MTEVIPFKPKHKVECEKNLLDFVERAKHDLSIYEDQGGFNSDNWKVTSKNGRTLSMHFTGPKPQGKKTGELMLQPFKDFAKAYMRDLQTWKERNPAQYMVVLKTIYETLIETNGKADILDFNGTSLRKTTESLERRLSKDALYRAGQFLEKLLNDIREYKINLTIPTWKNPWKRPNEKASGTSHEDRAWQENRLMTSHQISCLADAFCLAKTPYEQFYSSQAVLLMAAPSRGGELHFLTKDCLFETTAFKEVVDASGKVVKEEHTILNIRWVAAKGGGFIPKPVHPLIEPTVREAVRRLIDIGEPARRAAQWSIKRPNEFYRHDACITKEDHHEDDPLTILEFAAAMGLSQDNLPNDVSESIEKSVFLRFYKQKWIQKLFEIKDYVTYRDLAAYTVQNYKKPFPKFPNLSEINKPVSDMLCIVRDNELHSGFQPKGYSFTAPTINQLNDALGSIHDRIQSKTSQSLFTSVGLKEENGDNFVITSHQIRVWLSTMAERGEMESLDLAMFAGRSRIQDNRAYDLRPMEELAKESRKLINLGLEDYDGTKALQAVKVNVPVTFEMLGHKNRYGVVQASGFGYCEHDWTMSPCSKAGECVTCKEHSCIKGMPNTKERLLELEQVVKRELNRAVEADNNDYSGANSWVIYQSKKLAIIKTLLTYLDNDEYPEGLIIRVPEELDVSLTRIALNELGYSTGVAENSTLSERITMTTESNFLAILQGGI